MFSQMGKVLHGGLAWIVLLVGMLVHASLQAMELAPYPGVEVVESSAEMQVISRRIILGSLKKINNVLEPELVEFALGTRHGTTYFFPHERRVEEVAAFFRDQMSQSTSILFECKGRDCGSSNYWANTVYNRPILYGPEQYQRYMIGRSVARDLYIAVYVGQRGTRKIYAHIETIRVPVESVGGSEEEITAELRLKGHYVLTLPKSSKNFDSLLQPIASSMKSNGNIRLTLVIHDDLHDGETIEQSLERTSGLSQSIRASLVSAGIEPSRLSAYGVGPLSPREKPPGKHGSALRLELLVIE